MEKLKKVLLPVILVVILLLPILVNYINNRKVSVKDYSEFKAETSNSEFSLVYFGDTSDEKYKDIQNKIVDLRSKYEVDAFAVNMGNLSGEEIDELVEQNEKFEKGNVYALVKDGKIVKVIESSNTDYLEGQINKYVNNEIPEDEIAYKTVETYKEFSALYKGKKTIMHVFGRNTCYYCNIFKPVYNDLAAENNLDVYYYDSDSFDSTEYNKILNSGIKIPAECASSGEETPLSSGFGTPLTLFTKNGKVTGCISGYVDSEKLETKLKEVGMLK